MTNEILSTLLTRKRYDRIAPFYDLMEWPLELYRFSAWRSELNSRIVGPRGLEVGVGTGKNMPYYPPEVEITAIDLSPKMLARARKRSKVLGRETVLREMDVQYLKFPDQSFDTVFATFVFCSVTDPIAGLKELHRVCKKNGRLFLLEHVRPEGKVLGWVFDRLNPLIVRMVGANINRRTIDNICRAGWRISGEKNVASNIIRWVEAHP